MRHGETRVLKVAGDGHCPAPRGALVGMEGGSDGAAASGRRQAPAQQAARERRAQWQTGPHGSAVASAALPALSPPLGQVWRWRWRWRWRATWEHKARRSYAVELQTGGGRAVGQGTRAVSELSVSSGPVMSVAPWLVTYLYHRPDIIIISASTG